MVMFHGGLGHVMSDGGVSLLKKGSVRDGDEKFFDEIS